MIKKTLIVSAAAILVGSFMFACSSSSSSSGGYSCPSVGDKNCPNDTAATQADVDSCNKCFNQSVAYAQCENIPAKAACDSSGKSVSATIDTSKCQSQLSAVVSCEQGGSADGG